MVKASRPHDDAVTDRKYPELDIDASLEKLSEWLLSRKENKYDYSEDSRRHRGLAERLRSLAVTLDDPEWFFLESEFDKDPPPEVGDDGYPIPFPGDNTARYKGLIWRLRELTETAERMADENPTAYKPELPMVADFFLHLWLDAGNDKPVLYDKSPAVTAFKSVLHNAGYALSDERVRGILTTGLKSFDPYFCLDRWQLERFMVWRQ